MSKLSGDLPTFVGSSYTSSAYNPLNLAVGNSVTFGNASPVGVWVDEDFAIKKLRSKLNENEETVTMSGRRVVQVIVADPNENVPLKDCLLYEGKVHLTDLTDQELYFELDIKNMLAKHNEKRVKFVDKKVKDRVEYLEPAKVRDLKMIVVTVAQL